MEQLYRYLKNGLTISYSWYNLCPVHLISSNFVSFWRLEGSIRMILQIRLLLRAVNVRRISVCMSSIVWNLIFMKLSISYTLWEGQLSPNIIIYHHSISSSYEIWVTDICLGSEAAKIQTKKKKRTNKLFNKIVKKFQFLLLLLWFRASVFAA